MRLLCLLQPILILFYFDSYVTALISSVIQFRWVQEAILRAGIFSKTFSPERKNWETGTFYIVLNRHHFPSLLGDYCRTIVGIIISFLPFWNNWADRIDMFSWRERKHCVATFFNTEDYEKVRLGGLVMHSHFCGLYLCLKGISVFNGTDAEHILLLIQGIVTQLLSRWDEMTVMNVRVDVVDILEHLRSDLYDIARNMYITKRQLVVSASL